jgi:hypothetical protein
MNHGVEGDDCCGGGRVTRGGVNEGPTYCTEEPYWGVVKKACCVDQYRTLPMYGLRKDD